MPSIFLSIWGVVYVVKGEPNVGRRERVGGVLGTAEPELGGSAGQRYGTREGKLGGYQSRVAERKDFKTKEVEINTLPGRRMAPVMAFSHHLFTTFMSKSRRTRSVVAPNLSLFSFWSPYALSFKYGRRKSTCRERYLEGSFGSALWPVTTLHQGLDLSHELKMYQKHGSTQHSNSTEGWADVVALTRRRREIWVAPSKCSSGSAGVALSRGQDLRGLFCWKRGVP